MQYSWVLTAHRFQTVGFIFEIARGALVHLPMRWQTSSWTPGESGTGTALDSWAARGALHLSFLSKRTYKSRVASDCPDPARPGSAVQQRDMVESDQGRVGKVQSWAGLKRLPGCFTAERPVASPGPLTHSFHES